MRVAVSLVALAVSISLFGCSDDKPALSPPTSFGASTVAGFVVLSWTPQAGVDGYELEGREASGAWVSLLEPGEIIPADVDGGPVQLPYDVPERLALEFRIRSARGGARSAWATAACDTGIRGPEAAMATAAVHPATPLAHTAPVTVTWLNRSAIAIDARVERARIVGGATGAYEVLSAEPLVTGTNTFVDTGVEEGAAYAYRISHGLDGAWSASTDVSSQFVDVVAPTGLSATVTARGVELTWMCHGATSTLLVARQDPGQWSARTIASLPAGTSAYLDPVAAVWPGTKYEVFARPPLADYLTLGGAPATLATVDLASPVVLHGTARPLPLEGQMAAAASGLLHLLQQDGRALAAWRDTGAGWDTYPLDGVYFAGPGVRVDGAGHPHYVWYRAYPGTEGAVLAHGWWDDSGWHVDDLPAPVLPADDATFVVAPDGTLHVVHSTQYTATTGSDIVYVTGSAGAYAWTVIATSGVAGPWVRHGPVAVADDGIGGVLLATLDAGLWLAELVTRDSVSGSFTRETIPAPGSDLVPTLVGMGRGGAAALVARRLARPAGIWQTFLVRRSAGAWAPEEEIADFDPNDLRGAALSPDADRLHLLVARYPGPLELRVRTASGWSAGPVGHTTPRRTATGYWPDGRLHLEAIISAEAVDAALFGEPAP